MCIAPILSIEAEIYKNKSKNFSYLDILNMYLYIYIFFSICLEMSNTIEVLLTIQLHPYYVLKQEWVKKTSLLYIYVCVCVCVCIYIYIYICHFVT